MQAQTKSSQSNQNGQTSRYQDDIQKIVDGFARATAGDLATRIKLSGDDPGLNAIANAFNEMIKEIRKVTDEMKGTDREREQTIKKLKKIFETSNDIILQLNKYGLIVDINKSVKNILGYDPDEMIGKHFAKSGVIPVNTIPILSKKFNEAVTTGKARNIVELELMTKDGTRLCMEASISLIFDKVREEIDGAVIVMRDITKHIKADEELNEQRQKLRSVLASIEDMIFILDKEMRFIEYHPSLEHPDPSISVRPNDYIGRPIKDIFPKQASQELEKAVKACLKTKKSQQVDYPWGMLGATLWFNARISPLLAEDGSTTGVTVVVRDITNRIKTERALEESEKKYRKIFENSPQGFIVLDTEGHIIDVNKKICDWLGYKPEEILGKDHILYPFLTKSGKITAMQKFVQRMSGKVVPAYELEFITKNGETFLGEVLALQIRDEEGKVVQILAMITDITNREKK